MPTEAAAPDVEAPQVQAAAHSDSDEDVSFSQIILRKANAWVDMHAKNAKLDRNQEAYLERVKRLLAGGATDRSQLERRTRSGIHRWKESSKVYQATLTVARLYYDQENHCRTIRPWKVCGHADYDTLGRHYECWWRDPGWHPPDHKLWKPADFVAMFPDLLEDYLKVL